MYPLGVIARNPLWPDSYPYLYCLVQLIAGSRPDSHTKRNGFIPHVSKNQVAVFYTGQNADWQRPLKVVSRAEARVMKENNLGAFISHGRAFLLNKKDPSLVAQDQPQPDPKDASSRGDGRGAESVCIQEETMRDYAAGFRRARTIIKEYHPNILIQPLLRIEAVA